MAGDQMMWVTKSLGYQKSFWRFVGILSLVIMILYCGGIPLVAVLTTAGL